MKVQKSVSRALPSKEYIKHQVVIPNAIMEQLGWAHGDQLEARISPKGLLLYKVARKPVTRKLDYEEFKQIVIKTLSLSPNGYGWSELKQLAGLDQTTPSPVWVKRLEDDNILIRSLNPKTSQMIWSLRDHVFGQIHGKLNGWIP